MFTFTGHLDLVAADSVAQVKKHGINICQLRILPFLTEFYPQLSWPKGNRLSAVNMKSIVHPITCHWLLKNTKHFNTAAEGDFENVVYLKTDKRLQFLRASHMSGVLSSSTMILKILIKVKFSCTFVPIAC